MKPKVLILRTAGTNCDYETDHAFQLVGAETSLIHVNQLIAGKVNLMDYQIMAIPGGFSYGDDVAAGILLANEMRYKLADSLAAYVESGRLMIGICNGFQVLVRAGLLPRLDSHQGQQTTLAMNTSAKFECRWIQLETQESTCIFTQGLKPRVYLPVAHAEGRFTAPQPILDQIEINGQVVFRYASTNGGEPEYPDNPNGSDNHVAGICDLTGRGFWYDAAPGTVPDTAQPSPLDAGRFTRRRGRSSDFSKCCQLCIRLVLVRIPRILES